MQFHCKKCGRCCETLGRVKDQIEQDRTLLTYQLVFPPYSIDIISGYRGLPLIEWEVQKLEKEAEKLNLRINIKPAKVIFDLHRNISLVTGWVLDEKICPFLINQQCRIYDKRPFTCKQYPLLGVGYAHHQSGIRPVYYISEQCPQTKDLFFEGSFDELQKGLKSFFGNNIYFSCLQAGMHLHQIQLTVNRLVQENKIRPAVLDKGLMKKIKDNRKIGLFEFLISEGVITKEKYSQIIQDIESYVHAQQQYYEGWKFQ